MSPSVPLSNFDLFTKADRAYRGDVRQGEKIYVARGIYRSEVHVVNVVASSHPQARRIGREYFLRIAGIAVIRVEAEVTR